MPASHTYPVFLSLAGARCLVAGAGAVGMRKLSGLLDNGVAEALVLDIRPLAELSPRMRALMEDARVTFRQGQCAEADIHGCLLVFAATASSAENRRIAQLCAKAGILCNSATEPDNGHFILPACARAGSLCAAISTAGQSPHLAKTWRRELQCWLRDKERAAALFGELRPLVAARGAPQPENAALYGQVSAMLVAGEIDKCLQWLKSQFPASMHGRLALIFAGYAHAFP